MAPVLAKSLSRLSRDSLIDLCLKWTRSQACHPYLASNRNLVESEEEDYLHEPADNAAELRGLYRSLKGEKSDGVAQKLTKREIIDRIVDGDWRRGLSLHQLATIDFAYLEQNDAALRWSALKVVPLVQSEIGTGKGQHPAKRRRISPTTSQTTGLHYPEVSPASFLAALKAQISPLVKAHYHVHRLTRPSRLTIIRLHVVPNVPFAPLSSNIPRNARLATDSGRVMYIALPDSCPYVYVSLSGSGPRENTKPHASSKPEVAKRVDVATIKRVVLEAIPKALSRPQQRWALETTRLTTRSLQGLALLRGNGKPGTTGGAFSTFSQEVSVQVKDGVTSTFTTDVSPLEIESVPESPQDEHTANILRRFGPADNKRRAILDRVQVNVQDLSNPSVSQRRKRKYVMDDEPIEEDQGRAPVSMAFSGSDVFAGLRQLALHHPSCVDPEKLPSWLTGEANVSSIRC